MAHSTRTAIYLSPNGPVVTDVFERYEPIGRQSLLRVDYSGITPADIKHAGIGFHSSVAGYEMGGEVLESGPDSPFKPGDNAPGLKRPLYMGAHQDYAIAAGNFWYQVPSTGRMGLREAATAPVMTLTAADGLFHLLDLGFPEAGIMGTESQALLIWGAASTVGLAAVQLAKAAGHGPIFATASAKNHATLKSLGADYCFDYNDGDVVEQIRNAIQASGKPVRHAFDAVGAGCFAHGEDLKKSTPVLTAASISLDGQQDQELMLACSLPVREDSRYKMCFATRGPASPGELGWVADLEAWYEMQSRVMNWVTENFGEGKYVGCPRITVVKGTRACLEAMVRVAEGKSSLEKIAIEHPL